MKTAVISLVFCLVGMGQTYDFGALDRFLTATAARVPSGFEVLIVQDGREIYWKEFGNWKKNEQAKIASASKWFSGAVIMSLVDDGVLSLDDRASRFLPYMTGDKEAITVRQLMSHTSGFGGEFPVVHSCLGDSSDTLDHCAQALAAVPLQAAPGTSFIYSGAGMQVAGRVAEVASGKDWQTLFRERIAAPLGMTSTDYEYEGPTRNPRISGGGRSTATDYMKFLTMLQQRGTYEGRRVLSSRAVDAMLANQVAGAQIVDTPSPENWRYGIGNWLEEPDGAGRTMQNSSTGLAGWIPMLDRSRNLQVVIGMQNAVRPFQPHYPEFRQILQRTIPVSSLTAMGVTNGASFEASPVAPGEVMALFGNNLGPASLVTGGSGVLPVTLAGTQVAFDGVAAPLLYTSSGQVGVVAPLAVSGKSTVDLQVIYNGSKSPLVRVPVVKSWPALFGAVLNEDGSVNGSGSPAGRGTVLQFFGTGGGSPMEDVRVTIGGVGAVLSYAGPAPGLVDGVFQVNAVVPGGAGPGNAVPVVVQVGSNSSLPNVMVAVR